MYQKLNADRDIITSNIAYGNYYAFDNDDPVQIDQQQQVIDNEQQVTSQQSQQVPTNKSAIQKEKDHQISFDEIDAIINSKDFGDIVQQKANVEQVFSYSQINNNQITTYEQQAQIEESNNQENFIAYEQQPFMNNQEQNYCQQQEYEQYYKPIQTNQLDQLKSPSDNQSPDATNMMADNQANKNLFNFQYQQQQPEETGKPYVEIVEQPAKCSLRFRYKCEGRSAGSLPGVSSTSENKTFPAIRIHNYVGRAVVVVSCVTRDAPYRAHPHNIVGKDGCKKGICTIVISNNEPNTSRAFSSLGIQCVKRKDIEESLNLRESINVDPFRNGFAHKLSASTIDLNVVRLSFQVFIVGSTPNKCDVPLMPVVSDPIHDKKAMSDLVITKLSHCSAPATGGREIILLCDRISKDDVQVRFYEEQNGKLVWETYSDLSPTDVHKQVAICFKTPKYYNENITQPVMVRIQLKRASDNQVSEPRLFQFLPCESDEDIISRKRQKIEWVNMNHFALNNIFQPQQHNRQANQNSTAPNHGQQQQATLDISRQRSPIPEASSSPLQTRRTSPLPPTQQPQFVGGSNRLANEPISSRTPSPSQHHQQQQQNNCVDGSQNVVVRREIIDNDGKVMRLVDRPTDNRVEDGPLGNSLDRINTAELMHDVAFNSNMDLNLGSNLSMNMNPPD